MSPPSVVTSRSPAPVLVLLRGLVLGNFDMMSMPRSSAASHCTVDGGSQPVERANSAMITDQRGVQGPGAVDDQHRAALAAEHRPATHCLKAPHG